MRTVCLVTPVEDPDRFAHTQAHFATHGVGPVEYFHGLHKTTSGLTTAHPYMVDRGPGSPDEGVPYYMGPHPTNIWLGHYFLWQALKLTGDESWFILECDAKFPDGWADRLQIALLQVATHDPDWDLLYVGSCNARGFPKVEVAPGLYEIHGSGPQCNHAYILRAKAVPVLEEALRKVWAPIDIQQTVECFKYGVPLPRGIEPVRPPSRKLAVYTVLPRIVGQWNTEIPE